MSKWKIQGYDVEEVQDKIFEIFIEFDKICKKYNLKLILDAAHMSGTKVNGICPGIWKGVDVAVYSYQAVKNLPTGCLLYTSPSPRDS